MHALLVAIIVLVLGTDCKEDVCERVAIIGAGIGGGAVAYYSSQLSNCTQLRVYESRDYIGGRLKHTHIAGNVIELGGDAWSTANEYVVELVKALGINTTVAAKRRYQRPGALGDPIDDSINVWNGTCFLPVKGSVFKHPLSDLSGAVQELKFLRALKRNYKERGRDAFHSVGGFLSHGSLDQFTTVSARSYYSRHHISQVTQTDIAEPLMRVIYDQGLEAHAFSSLVAFTSAIGAGSVSAGNSELVEALFRHSGAIISLNTTVQKVEADATGGYTVTSSSGGVVERSHVDRVVLASPLEYTGIEFAVPQAPPVQRRSFVHCHVTVVRCAGVNPEYFGLPRGSQVPENILTTSSASASTPFNVLQLEVDVGANDSIFKLFSNTDLQQELPEIFLGIQSVLVQDWPYTFPMLVPVQNATDYQPIVWAPGLYYLNTMESVASAMEGSVIAGRNVAILMAEDMM